MPPGSTNRVKVDNFEELTGITQTVAGDVRITNGALIVDVLNLTNSHPLTVAVVDGNGSQLTSFGGGTQYTEGDTDASITGTAMLWEDGSDTLRSVSAAKPLPVAIISGAGSGGTAAVDDAAFTVAVTSFTPSGGIVTADSVDSGDGGAFAMLANRQQKVTLYDSSAAEVVPLTATVYNAAFGTAGTADSQVMSVQGIASMTPLLVTEGSQVVLGTATYTEATSVGLGVGAVRRDADTTLVNTTNEWGPLQMDANGRLKVEAFSGETLPVSGTVTANMGTVTADPFGANADAASATGSISAKLRFIASTGIPITGTVTVGTHAVTVASGGIASGAIASGAVASGAVASGAYASGALAAGSIAAGAIADMIVDDAAFTPATSRVLMAGFEADESSTDSVDEGDGGAARMTLDRKQIVTLQPHTAGGLTTFMASGSDGSSILVATKQTIKNSAGQLYEYYVYNPEAAVTFLHFYNTDTVTVGTTNPLRSYPIPAGSAANLSIPQGVIFDTAISCAATTTAGGNTAPSTGLSLVVGYK